MIVSLRVFLYGAKSLYYLPSIPIHFKSALHDASLLASSRSIASDSESPRVSLDDMTVYSIVRLIMGLLFVLREQSHNYMDDQQSKYPKGLSE